MLSNRRERAVFLSCGADLDLREPPDARCCTYPVVVKVEDGGGFFEVGSGGQVAFEDCYRICLPLLPGVEVMGGGGGSVGIDWRSEMGLEN